VETEEVWDGLGRDNRGICKEVGEKFSELFTSKGSDENNRRQHDDGRYKYKYKYNGDGDGDRYEDDNRYRRGGDGARTDNRNT
jgi:hypothetical protein